MVFYSIFFQGPKDDFHENSVTEPDFFPDLHIDQIVDAIISGYEEYNLKPYFYAPLPGIREISYRHEIVRDLENEQIHTTVTRFAKGMQMMRNHLVQSEKLYYYWQKLIWFLDAARIYCDTVQGLALELDACMLTSKGFSDLKEYLKHYVASELFKSLYDDIKQLTSELATVSYCLIIRGKEITVRKYEPGDDFSDAVVNTFARFLDEPARYFHENFPDYPEMNHIEGQILDFVARLYHDVFSHLELFRERYDLFLDSTIERFDREVQFYFAYLQFIDTCREKGLSFSLPVVSDTDKNLRCWDGFDLALVTRLVRENRPVICNDFILEGEERIFVITGPNQGGKTTYARTFGQLHYLARLGCPVPGREVRLYLCDQIYTHFEKEEDIENLMSKLEDDLVRIHDIFTKATSRSIIIINEMFTSTTVQDALFLGKQVLKRAIDLDLLCTYVTFLDELTKLEKTVSLVSGVDAENPDIRTYKIERRPADGLSYAHAIARKNRLTYQDIMERIKS